MRSTVTAVMLMWAWAGWSAPGQASVDEALSYALGAARPYVQNGFTIRSDYWGGDLPLNRSKAIAHQLYKGNEYWFWMGTDEKSARVSVHVYDNEGNLAEVETWARGHYAAARVVPKKSGTYYILVEVTQSNVERTSWGLAYGYR
jgi:hypothetical protein